MNGLLNILGGKRSSKITLNSNLHFKEIVKGLAAHIRETKNQLKEKSSLKSKMNNKDSDSDSTTIKQKITEYIKNNFKEKKIKAELKSFFVIMGEEYFKIISGILSGQTILNSNSQITIDTILSLIKNFYDFSDDILYISSKEIINQIEMADASANDSNFSSYFICLVYCLSHSKSCDVVDFLLDKDNEIADIGVKTSHLLNAFYKATKYLTTCPEDKCIHSTISKSLNYLIPQFVELFSNLINDSSMKTVFLLMESGDLSKIFNDISSLRSFRICLFDIFIKVNTTVKDGFKIRFFRKYITDYSCIEGMFSNIKNNYYVNDYNDLYNDIVKEILFILLICNGYYEDQSDIKSDIFIFLLNIFEDFILLPDNENFIEKMRKIIKEIFYLSYIDKDDIKNKLSEKSLKSIDSTIYLVNNFMVFKDKNILEFLIDVFVFVGKLHVKDGSYSRSGSGSSLGPLLPEVIFEKTEYVRKFILLCILGEDPTLNKYKFIINNTNYCSKILENLYNFSEEMISYPLNTLLDMISDYSTSHEHGLTYIPEKEVKAIIKSVVYCQNGEILNAILKHFKTFLDFSPFFQRLFVNCGFLNKIVEVIEKSLYSLEVKKDYDNSDLLTNSLRNSEPSINPYSAEMIINLLKTVELVLNNRQENISRFKSYSFLDNFFDRLTAYSEYKLVAYKIWNICMLYEDDSNQLIYFTKFLLKRYYNLKENLKKNKTDFKSTFNEIYQLNQIICTNFLNENIANGTNNNFVFLKEVLLDFINLLKSEPNPESTRENFEKTENLSGPITNYVWDIELQNILKNYFSNFLNLIVHFNKNIFTIKFKLNKLQLNKISKNIEPLVKIEDFTLLIKSTISYLNEQTEKSFLLDFIKFLIDSSLRFKLNERENNKTENDTSIKRSSFIIDESVSRRGTGALNITITTAPTLSDFRSSNIFIYNLYDFYKNKFKVEDSLLNNSYSSISNLSNFILQSPFIIKIILRTLLKIKNEEIFIEFLEFFDFLCKVNENNIKILLKQNVIKTLLKILRLYKDSSLISNKVMEIFEIICKFMDKNQIEAFFQFIITFESQAEGNTNYNANNLINRLLVIFHKNYSFSRKIKRNIVLSSIITRQPNIYNMLYTANFRFYHPNQMKEIKNEFNFNNSTSTSTSVPLSSTNKNKTTPICISIFLSLKFHKKLDNISTLTLFKFEKENLKERAGDLTNTFDVSIDNGALVVKENEKELYNNNQLTNFIRIEKSTNFMFILNKESGIMEIFINEKVIDTPSLDFKFLDINASYILVTGYSGSSTQELYQDSFQLFPHVTISYMMIYADRISKENLIHFKLSQIFNSKNGSARANIIKLKYLNEKSYKMFAPHYINQKEILKYVRLNIDSEKVLYELIADKFDLLSNNKIVNLKSDQNVLNNFIYKINRKYNIDILDKNFLVFIPNTNIMNIDSIIRNNTTSLPHTPYSLYNNTYLLSKVNLSDSIYLNQIFDIRTIKTVLLSEVIGIHNSSILDYAAQGFRIIQYLLVILSQLDQSQISIQCNVLKILSLYLISNLHDLNEFCESNDFQALLIILYKNSKCLNKEMIDYILNLSLGVNDMKGINFFNPWYPKWITNILLDIHLFKLLSSDIKIYILQKLGCFLNQKDYIFIMYEANIETKVIIINKLYKIFMLIESDDQIEEMIISLINNLLEQTLKFKKGDVEPTEEQLNRIISSTQEFFFICNFFNESITNHLSIRDFDTSQLNTTRFLVKKFYSKLFNENTKIYMTKIFNFFTRIREEVTSRDLGRRGTSLNVGVKVGNLLKSNFFKKLYLDQSNTHMNYIKENIMKTNIGDNVRSTVNFTKKSLSGSIKSGGLDTPSPIDDIRNTIGVNVNSAGHKFNFSNKSEWMIIEESNESKPITIGEEYITSENKKFCIKNADFDTDFECIGYGCILCGFFRESIKNSYNIIKYFNTFKNYTKKIYYHLFHKNSGKNIYLDKFFSNRGINFSWYIFNHEGPSRIRNKLVTKMDEIKNEELTKKYYEDIEKIIFEDKIHKNSLLNKLFDFMDIKTIFSEVLYNDQIFNLNIVRNLVDEDDNFLSAYNCLMIQECYHLDCVLVLGEKKFYIFVNLHIDKNGNLLYPKIKFKRSFWVLNDYDGEWERACPYLNNIEKTQIEMKNEMTYDETNVDLSKYEMNSKLRKLSDEIKMYKFSRSRKGNKTLSYFYTEINELHKRRFLLKNNSLEFFMNNGKNFLLAFNIDKRDHIFANLLKGVNTNARNNTSNNGSKKINYIGGGSNLIQSSSSVYLKNPKTIFKKHKGKLKKKKDERFSLLDYKQILDEYSQNWAEGVISNYSYLMILNTISGRSYSDISQYFIMPWIIKEYHSDGLNLNTDEIYRNLQYPIHALDESSKCNLRQKLAEVMEETDKFHSGSHYSNPGFACYYLIRLKPFSLISAEIQGGYFDMANRVFFNIKSIWDVSDKYQELVPEIFHLPEIFSNYNEFDFGLNENKLIVNDVILPSWAKSDPRLFVKMQKKAMESTKVSQKICDWIDLIYGYKQQGTEAFNNFNTFRNLCYEGKIDFKKLDEKEIEDKMIEIHEMGQIPTQLFIKPHPRKERHQKVLAFFARPSYLMNFLPQEKIHNLILDTNPSCIKGYFEISEPYVSGGEGGLASFTFYNNDYDDKNAKISDAMNTFTIVGDRKILIGPKFINFIDFSTSKYSFLLVKPLARICYEFHTFREASICDIKTTSDGRKLVIAFSDGVISLYKLKKLSEKIIHPDYEKNKVKKFLQKIQIRRSSDIYSSSKFISKLIKKNTQIDSSAYNTNSGGEIKITCSPENISLGNDEILAPPSVKEIQYPIIKFFNSNEEFRDHFIHYNLSGLQLQKKENSKGTSLYAIFKLSSDKYINSSIKFMELCEAYSLLIIVDEIDNIYLFDINKFKLLRQIEYKSISPGQSIKFIRICGLSGEFVVCANYTVFMFNVNGVLIGNLDVKEFESSNHKIGKITCAVVKSLKNTESEIHLFTGHDTGSLIMWRLQMNKIFSEDYNLSQNDLNTGTAENILDAYRFAYNRKYYLEKVGTQYDLRLKFVPVNEFTITKKNVPLRAIKLTEDCSMLITIHDDSTIMYFNYSDYFVKKIKNKPSIKFCPQCNSQLGSSKINCALCDKKLCGRCKIEQIIPEISFKSSKPVCNDCLSMICSTNKMLYDF